MTWTTSVLSRADRVVTVAVGMRQNHEYYSDGLGLELPDGIFRYGSTTFVESW
jgi:hypothetical protein